MSTVLKSFRLQVIARVLFLATTMGLWFVLFLNGAEPLPATELMVGGIFIAQVVFLVRYVERANLELARFFESIKHADFSRSFSLVSSGTSFKELQTSFNNVIDRFRETRQEREEQLRYVDTVVQHVGVGLISFGPAGEIQLMNNAARRLLRVAHARDVSALGQISGPLVESMLSLRPGENALVKVQEYGLQLSLHATQFKMKDKLYTLISLQNISGELERERMSKELEIARDLQRRLLPLNGFSFDGYDIAGRCIPAEEVGGDYYDFLRLKDNKLGIVIGDVSGKGVPAAIYMTLTKGIVQAFAAQTGSPKDVLEKVNSLMYGTIDKGSFMTMMYAICDPGGGTSTLARAGHHPALVYTRTSDSVSHITSNGIALGMRDDATFGAMTGETRVHLQPDDLLVFYTDGITEAMNKNQEEYGVDRLSHVVRENHGKTAREIITAVHEDVNSFVGNRTQHDDMTLVVLKAVA